MSKLDSVDENYIIENVLIRNLTVAESREFVECVNNSKDRLKKEITATRKSEASPIDQKEKYTKFLKNIDQNPEAALNSLGRNKEELFECLDKNIKEKMKSPHSFRRIESISDYLNAILDVFSNIMMLRHSEIPIIRQENLFSLIPTAFKEAKQRGVFFRGEPSNFNYTIPSLYRSIKTFTREPNLIERMKLSFPTKFSRLITPFDQLAIMQHHGLATRILDLSTNALVALYFAVSDKPNEDGYVIPFMGRKITDENDIKDFSTPYSDRVAIKVALSKLTIYQKQILAEYYHDKKDQILRTNSQNTELDDAIGALYHFIRLDNGDFTERIIARDLFDANLVLPDYSDNRIIRQSGAFLITGLTGLHEAYSGKNEDILNVIQREINHEISKYRILYDFYLPGYSNHCNGSSGLAKIKIRHEYKEDMLGELNLLGINKSTIYPDMDHQAQYINNYFS